MPVVHLANLLGFIRLANFNTTVDQPIVMPIGRYIIRRISVMNASVSLTTAVGGIYSAASKGGQQIVAAAQVYSGLVNSSNFIDLTLTAATLGNTATVNTIFFSLSVAQGVPATAHILVFGDDLNPGVIF